MTVGRITQETVEVLSSNIPNARVTQESVEVLSSNIPNGRVTQVAVEVLYSVPSGDVEYFAATSFIGINKFSAYDLRDTSSRILKKI